MSHLTSHGFELIKQGAEAKLYLGPYLGKMAIIKERFPKSYRHPTLDVVITKERTKSEAKAILKATLAGIRAPTIYMIDYGTGRIYMEYIDRSITVKDYILDIDNRMNENPQIDHKKLLDRLTEKIGLTIGRLHENNIIHGDLTTSNMLLAPPDGKEIDDFDQGEIVMLDFGLSHIDSSAEDKGVDLYVLERALLSTHSTIPHLFDDILSSYRKQNRNQSKDILIKFEEVRARGRKRTMFG